ncbi:TraR/DksA family transcriptional regulator [Stutzerimonas nitrititolerans]|uniref:TraR/DksA family transcriptional regulator n=1 Tax=Stutzerimonas nitrititolerans TaxID=2482751 RepID=UPI0028A8B83B|nr:TraR/DksA family transcriptional regulator [Stutzerimonas nitrititolerans]
MADVIDRGNEQAEYLLEVALARRAQLPTGPSAMHCEECGGEIPQARREAVPGCQTCIDCQTLLDKRDAGVRRG